MFLSLKIQQEKIPLKLSTLKVLTGNLLIVSKQVQTHTAMGNTPATTTAQQVIAEQNAATQSASVASSNAAQGQPVAENTNDDAENKIPEGTVKKFALDITRVQLYDNTDIASVWLTFKKAIPGFILKDNDYVPGEVTAIGFSRSGLTRFLCESDDMIATMRDGQNDPFTRAQLSTILHGATLNVTRTFHRTGYIREDGSAIDRDQWFTDIESCKLTEFAKQLIQQVVIHRIMDDNQ